MFLRTHLVDRRISVHIRFEPVQRCAALTVDILSIFIEDAKIADYAVSMRFHNLYNLRNRIIQSLLSLLGSLISTIVFNRHRIRENIICQHLSVPVVYPSSGTGNIDFLADLHGKVFRILFSSDNLKIENPGQQNAGKSQKYKQQNKYS